MKIAQLILITALLITLEGCSSHQVVEREPSNFFPNYSCARLLSFLAGDPYQKTYPLKKYNSFEDAQRAFDKKVDQDADKVKLGSQAFRIIKKDADGEPIKGRDVAVLLHGYSDSPGSMRKPAEYHSQMGHHVLANRLPDHGLIEPLQKDALDNSSLEAWRKSVDETLAMAKAMAGENGRVHIVGYSMGATLAMDASWRHPGLIASRTLHAPLFKENGLVLSFPLYLLKLFTSGSFFKKVDETDTFYKRMTYQQTIEMHRLTRQIQPRLLDKSDDIPTAIFRVDPKHETTVDDNYIDAFAKEYGIRNHYTYTNPENIPDPVLHRDLPMARLNSNGADNPALETIERGMLNFFWNLRGSQLRFQP